MTDNLNRATAIGGVACTNDILGNRLTKGTASYGWDVLNRMTSYTSPSPDSITTWYTYRADGMRVSKSDSTGSAVYRYDGQMCMQDVETPTSGTATITNYALGARGIDAVSKTDGADPAVVGYPIYDAHGNRVATLTKSGTSFSLTDVRTYDAWGNVRVGAQTGRPRARYCATLGHVQDDESSLVYMRARYYEPTSGRFVSEDPAETGLNFYSFSRNDPVNRIDRTGKYDESSANAAYALLWLAVIGYVTASEFACSISNTAKILHASSVAFLAAYFLLPNTEVGGTLGDQFERANRVFVGAVVAAIAYSGSTGVGCGSPAAEAVGFFTEYTAFLGVFMALDSLEDQLR